MSQYLQSHVAHVNIEKENAVRLSTDNTCAAVLSFGDPIALPLPPLPPPPTL